MDAVLLAALLMFASLLLRLTTRSVESKGEMIVTGIITSMITIGKVAYAPLAILPPCFVLIRDRRFTRQFVTYSTISLLAIVLWALWAVEIHRMVFSMRPDVIVDPQAQLSHLLHNPTFALGVLLHTSHIYLLPVLIETMGHTLGYATIWIKGYLIAILLISILLSGAIEDRPTGQAPDVTYFALSFSVSAICALVVLLLLYLQFNPVGWPIIEGAQGRYFLPLLYLCLALAPTISLPVLTRTAAPQIGFSVYFIGLSGISALTLGIMVLRRYWI